MYKIRGGDQKEYGPVTAEQVREWIKQRRANAQTMVQRDGTAEWLPLGSLPEFAAVGPLPPVIPASVTPMVVDDDPMSQVVPFKNPKALTAYYLAIFSLIPCLGLPLGITALCFGLGGLKFLKIHPNAHGRVHAWIGIILGGLCALANAGVGGAMLVAFIVEKN